VCWHRCALCRFDVVHKAARRAALSNPSGDMIGHAIGFVTSALTADRSDDIVPESDDPTWPLTKAKAAVAAGDLLEASQQLDSLKGLAADTVRCVFIVFLLLLFWFVWCQCNLIPVGGAAAVCCAASTVTGRLLRVSASWCCKHCKWSRHKRLPSLPACTECIAQCIPGLRPETLSSACCGFVWFRDSVSVKGVNKLLISTPFSHFPACGCGGEATR